MNNVPPGYKQTEVGVIPEDWTISKLEKHLRERIRNGYSPVCPESFTGIWILSLASVTPNGFQSSGVKPAPLNDKQVQAADLTEGDIVVSRSNTPERVGLAGIYLGDPSPCSYSDLLMRVRVDESVDRQYLLFHLLSNTGRRIFAERARGSSGSMVKIDRSMLEAFPIPLPPTKAEQEAIAEVLSDADALIESLEQVIAKKRQVKQGAMQELLTGKRRLPGFSGEWEVKRLEDVASIQRGASPRPIDSPIWFDENSSVGWVRISDVTKSGIYLRETTQRLSPLGIQYSRPISRGSLIMSICATVGRPVITEIEACIHDGFVVFDNLRVDKQFLYYILKAIEGDWSRHGQTGSQMNLNTGMINRTEVLCPPLREQTAIAAILSDMDAEIAELEAKLAKARQVKQGMMQELLTGRIRLV